MLMHKLVKEKSICVVVDDEMITMGDDRYEMKGLLMHAWNISTLYPLHEPTFIITTNNPTRRHESSQQTAIHEKEKFHKFTTNQKQHQTNICGLFYTRYVTLRAFHSGSFFGLGWLARRMSRGRHRHCRHDYCTTDDIKKGYDELGILPVTAEQGGHRTLPQQKS